MKFPVICRLWQRMARPGLLLVVALPLLAPRCSGQSPEDYGIRSRKALKLYLEGSLAERYQEWGPALEKYGQALEEEPRFGAALAGSAHCLLQQNNLPQALKMVERLEASGAKPTANSLFVSGKVYFASLKFDRAEKSLHQLKTQPGVADYMLKEANHLLPRCAFGQNALANPVPFVPTNLGPGVNSAGEDYMPFLTADGQRLYWVARREDCTGGYDPQLRSYNEDFFWATRNGDGWNPGENLGPPVNTAESEGAMTLSPDGRIVIYTGCAFPGGMGSCDLYYAVFDGLRWSKPASLGPAVNSPHWESFPCLSPDGQSLYFVSSRPGGKGKSDIWVSRLANNTWQPATNLGAPVNSPGDESSPFLHADGQTLYFASDGHVGMGSFDLFKCSRTETGWSEPQNLGYPLNTPADERTLFVETGGLRGYISSRRPEGQGGLDLYSFDLHPAARPNPATYLRCRVRDRATQAPIAEAQVHLMDLATGDTVRHYPTNRLGQFLTSLPLGRRYAAHTEAQGYLFSSLNFDLSQATPSNLFDLVIDLDKLEKEAVVRLNNIFFDTDQATLKPESALEVAKLVQLLGQNPRMRVELRGHTDNQGSAEHNLNLSRRRAQAVADALVQQGIAPERLQTQGFGPTLPVAGNDTPEGRALNRRTEFRVLEN